MVKTLMKTLELLVNLFVFKTVNGDGITGGRGRREGSTGARGGDWVADGDGDAEEVDDDEGGGALEKGILCETGRDSKFGICVWEKVAEEEGSEGRSWCGDGEEDFSVISFVSETIDVMTGIAVGEDLIPFPFMSTVTDEDSWGVVDLDDKRSEAESLVVVSAGWIAGGGVVAIATGTGFELSTDSCPADDGFEFMREEKIVAALHEEGGEVGCDGSTGEEESSRSEWSLSNWGVVSSRNGKSSTRVVVLPPDSRLIKGIFEIGGRSSVSSEGFDWEKIGIWVTGSSVDFLISIFW
jgi:hypothetical protein